MEFLFIRNRTTIEHAIAFIRNRTSIKTETASIKNLTYHIRSGHIR